MDEWAPQKRAGSSCGQTSKQLQTGLVFGVLLFPFQDFLFVCFPTCLCLCTFCEKSKGEAEITQQCEKGQPVDSSSLILRSEKPGRDKHWVSTRACGCFKNSSGFFLESAERMWVLLPHTSLTAG